MNDMHKTGAAMSLTRLLLTPLSAVYAIVVNIRNQRYEKTDAVASAPVPVVSVGNITVGGAGKTPIVMATVCLLKDLGRNPGILTRGYGAAPGETADEVREYADAAPGVPVVVDPNRVSGAERAVREHGVDCLVMDDGFQHRALARDLDLVVVDALAPWGGGLVLPAGRLREPLRGLRRADLFVISRANQVADEKLRDIERVVASYNPDAEILLADVTPRVLVKLNGEEAEPAGLAYHNVLPVCGIGNPQTFLECVNALSGRVCGRRIFRDHQRYAPRHVRCIEAAAGKGSADLVVTTRKDWVKLAPLWRELKAKPELACLEVCMELRDSEQLFRRCLSRILENRRVT